MKPIKMCISILVVSMLLTGCGRKVYQSQLPDDCYIFDDYDFVSSEVDGDFCQAFEYNGQTYYFYSFCGTLHEDEANETLGRLKRDCETDDPYTIVSLAYNDSDDYLVHHWEGANLMAPQMKYIVQLTRVTEKLKSPILLKIRSMIKMIWSRSGWRSIGLVEKNRIGNCWKITAENT